MMEKKDKNKVYIILFIVIIGLALSATVVTYVIGNKKLDNETDYEDETKINSDQVTVRNFIISPNNLYINKYNETFTNYSKLTEVTYHNIQYYIENGKLFKKKDDLVSEVDISGETAKFIAEGWSRCSGNELMILTEEGNIYSIDMDFNVNKKYDGGNAKEILFINNYVDVNSTCNYYLPLALIDNELYHINSDGSINKEDKHKLVIYGDYILYSDGTMNAYRYNDKLNNVKEKDEYLTDENGNKIFISFLFETEKLYYIIDINGNLYSFSNYVEDEGIFKIELLKENNSIGKISNIKVASSNNSNEYKEIIKKIYFYDKEGNSFSYQEEENLKLRYVNSFIFE